VRRSLRLVLVLGLAIAPLLSACGGDDDGGDHVYVQLDGSPRHPDAEGVVEKVAADFSTITLDGKRTYELARDLQCFATQNGATVPVRGTVGGYVQVGLRGDTVVWLASIADVVRVPNAEPVVYYVGEAIDLTDGALVFRDGTTIRLGPSLHIPAPPKQGAKVTVTIDPATHMAVDVRA
jgi:hypothetical protein